MRQPQTETPPGGSREALGDTAYYDQQVSVYTKIAAVKHLLKGALVAAFIADFLAFAVVVALAILAVVGGGR